MAVKYYAPKDSAQHSRPARTASQQVYQPTTRSLHSEKRATSLIRRLSSRSAPTEGNRRWSLANLSNRRPSEQTERNDRSQNVPDQQKQGLESMRARRRERPALFLAIPEEGGSRNERKRFCIEEAVLDSNAEYSPVASSPFIPFDHAGQLEDLSNTTAFDPTDRISRSCSLNKHSDVAHGQDDEESMRASQMLVHNDQAACDATQFRKLHTAKSAAFDRPSRVSPTDAATSLNKPLPPLPRSLESQQPLKIPSATNAAESAPGSLATGPRVESGPKDSLQEDAEAFIYATLQCPFSTFEPAAFVADDSETDASDNVSRCSSASPLSACSTDDTSLTEPPPVPPRSDKRPSVRFEVQHCDGANTQPEHNGDADPSSEPENTIDVRKYSIRPNTSTTQRLDEQSAPEVSTPPSETDHALDYVTFDNTESAEIQAVDAVRVAHLHRERLEVESKKGVLEYAEGDVCRSDEGDKDRQKIDASVCAGPIPLETHATAADDVSISELEVTEQELVTQLASLAATINGVRASIVRRSSIRVAGRSQSIRKAVA